MHGATTTALPSAFRVIAHGCHIASDRPMKQRSHYNIKSSAMGTGMVSIPITLEQLIFAVQQLQPDEREQLGRVLVQMGLRSDLAALIQELYAQPPADDITDGDIMAEIQVVRQQSQQI